MSHRFSIAFLIVTAVGRCGPVVEPATRSTLPIQCRPCESSSNVILMIGLPSEDDRVRKQTRLWMEERSRAAQQFHKERTGETMRVVTRYPANIAEFRKEVLQMADDCMRIVSLGIMSHGNVGYLQIGGDGVTVRNIDEAFGHGLDCVMSTDASVEIAGCNVGRGCSGADFMLAAASQLLPRGGRIVAPEHYVYGNAFLGLTPRSILGDRELQVSADGSRPRWTRGSERGSECAARSGMATGNGHSSEH
jgi:Domain of unknown function (DUF4347)